MKETPVTVQGTIRPDGQLELDRPLPLAAGRVQVTVEPLPTSGEPDRFWKMMEGIWTDLRAGGRPSRSREEIDAEVRALREEAEEEMQAVERLHEACRTANQPPRSEGT
jgi:hypothetical protein